MIGVIMCMGAAACESPPIYPEVRADTLDKTATILVSSVEPSLSIPSSAISR